MLRQSYEDRASVLLITKRTIVYIIYIFTDVENKELYVPTYNLMIYSGLCTITFF